MGLGFDRADSDVDTPGFKVGKHQISNQFKFKPVSLTKNGQYYKLPVFTWEMTDIYIISFSML